MNADSINVWVITRELMGREKGSQSGYGGYFSQFPTLVITLQVNLYFFSFWLRSFEFALGFHLTFIKNLLPFDSMVYLQLECPIDFDIKNFKSQIL